MSLRSDGSLLYAAYGSNLDRDDLVRWCEETGHIVDLGTARDVAWLPDRRPAFTAFGARRHGGVLDIVPSVGAVTPCAVHAVDDQSLIGLDAKEASGVLYRRIETVALTDDLGACPVITYEILPERRSDFVSPHDDYVEVVRRGLAHHGHADAALNAAATGDSSAGILRTIFVYGTLKPGECRQQLLGEHGIERLEPASVAGTLIDLGRYPGLLAPPKPDDPEGFKSTGLVHGFIATVSDIAGLLERLDRIEGFSGWTDRAPLYWRRLVRTTGGALAWTYLYAADATDGVRLPHGRWSSIDGR